MLTLYFVVYSAYTVCTRCSLLSYRRDTALQGALGLQLWPKVEDWY